MAFPDKGGTMNVQMGVVERRDGGGEPGGVFLVPPPRAAIGLNLAGRPRFASMLPPQIFRGPNQRSGLGPPPPPQRTLGMNEIVEPFGPHPSQLHMPPAILEQGGALNGRQGLSRINRKGGSGKKQRGRGAAHGGGGGGGGGGGEAQSSRAAAGMGVAKGGMIGKKRKNMKWGGGGAQGRRGENSRSNNAGHKRNNALQANNAGKREGEGPWEPPRLRDLRRKNKAKTRKFFPRPTPKTPASMPHAPRNTSSYIMRANRLGIDAPQSASPATPAVLPTPSISSAPWQTEAAGERHFVEEAKAVKVVDPYGTMNAYIRLRPDAHVGAASAFSSGEVNKDEGSGGSEDVGSSGSSDSESSEEAEAGVPVSSVQQLERRMDHDLQRFEMLYTEDRERGLPGTSQAGAKGLLRSTRLDEQETLIAQLEEENLTLKERLYVMEQELRELRRRVGEGADHREVESGDSGDEASHAPQECHGTC